MNHSIKETFANNLSIALSEKDMSQKQLAGVNTGNESTISKYLDPTNNQMPGSEKLANIAKELEVSTDWLLGLSSRKKIGDQLSLHDIGEILIQCMNTPALSIRIDKVSSKEFYVDENYQDEGGYRANNRTAISFSDCMQCTNEFGPICDNYAPYGFSLNEFITSIAQYRELYDAGRIELDAYKALLSFALKKLSIEPLPPSMLQDTP